MASLGTDAGVPIVTEQIAKNVMEAAEAAVVQQTKWRGAAGHCGVAGVERLRWRTRCRVDGCTVRISRLTAKCEVGWAYRTLEVDWRRQGLRQHVAGTWTWLRG